MLLPRVFACSSSLGWPAFVFVVSAALALHPVRAEAESGTRPPPSCSEPNVVACADAAPNEACKLAAGSVRGRCIPSSCLDEGSATVPALACQSVAACDEVEASEYAAPCQGKTEGASCVPSPDYKSSGPGTCTASACYALGDGGIYAEDSFLECKPSSAPSSGGGDASAAAESSGSDSGCSAAAAGTPAASAPFAVVAGVALLFAKRRSRAVRRQRPRMTAPERPGATVMRRR